MTKVKICGITNLEDALLSAKFGADALGFNFYKKSPRYITPEKTREIIDKLPENILKVGVFVNEDLEKIVEIAETAKLDALQLHGEETPEFAKELKSKTNLKIIKAFRVSPEFKPEDVLKYETDAILLDAYNPKEHGGTGETFDWEIAKKVQEIFPKLYLAGGLSVDNVRKAIKNVDPFAVDSCSSLEKKRGMKDEQKIVDFIQVVRNAKAVTSIPEFTDVYVLLEFIQRHSSMFVGKYKLSELRAFLDGIEFGLNTLNEERFVFDWKQFRPESEYRNRVGFQSWISKKFLKRKEVADVWSTIILWQTSNNEEKAFDLFFELLEEFKLEFETNES
ncbi:MAG TPA: phosphoribosylanthranilate isomerase [Pyrinomonadaceae bacterium]|nr:phosphoribosylanthranilate isomerase [Pyrinomonadaceae bacterium]